MSSALLNAAPKRILRGIRDESGGDIPVIPEQLPTHLPHVFLFAEKGPDVELVSGMEIERTFGSKTLDLRSKYVTHQTPLAQKLNAEGNAMVIQRIKPDDAGPPARARLALEVTKEKVQVDEFERDSSGEIQLDENGDPKTTGETTQAYVARWVIEAIGEDDPDIGSAQKRDGNDIDDDPTDYYPIADLEVSSWGSHGRLKGFRIWAPNNASDDPDEELIRKNKAFAYNIQFVERPDEDSQPRTIETLTGSQNVEFMLKPGAFDDRVDQEKHADKVVIDAYQDLDALPRILGPFGRFELYQDYIDEVSAKLYIAEYQARKEISSDLLEDWIDPGVESWSDDVDPEDIEARYLINLFGAKDVDGNQYSAFRLRKGNSGANFSRSTTHYAKGGSDGKMSFEEFDKQVAKICQYYDERGIGGSEGADHNFMDTAVWPQSVIYDTGFSLETKEKMLTPIGLRKDISVIVSTQDVSQPQNSIEDESSIAIALRTAAEAYPESEIYGTPVCRAMVVGQSGKLINSQYKGLLPLTVDLAVKAARFMGRSNGIWRSNRGFDTSPYNQVTEFKDVNATYKPQNVYNQDWDNGLVWVQNFDRRSLFFPGIQTVYSDSTSVLNSAINMFICVEMQKVADRVWRRLTGTAKLTREQFRERSDELILDNSEGRFDDRVIIQPRTYFTDFDEQLGYSWSTDITLYLNNMMTVGTYTIIAKRRADFEE